MFFIKSLLDEAAINIRLRTAIIIISHDPEKNHLIFLTLPTEAEWEYAARGGMQNKKYPWGEEDPETGKAKANIWQGSFPNQNLNTDGFYGAAPVRSFASNAYKLYDMAGNVWEWCNTPDTRSTDNKIVRGGSFMCNPSYCKGYRVSSKMSTSPDTGLEHTGFRCVK